MDLFEKLVTDQTHYKMVGGDDRSFKFTMVKKTVIKIWSTVFNE